MFNLSNTFQTTETHLQLQFITRKNKCIHKLQYFHMQVTINLVSAARQCETHSYQSQRKIVHSSVYISGINYHIWRSQ